MIDAAKKYTSGGHPVEHLHRAPEGWAGPYPWRGMANGGEKTWTDEGKFYIWENYSEDDLTEVREPLRVWAVVNSDGLLIRTADDNENAMHLHPSWRIVEMIEVTPANNPPTA
jgi:hypothetical protein